MAELPGRSRDVGESDLPAAGEEGKLSKRDFEDLKRTRRHPRPTQSDYLHIRYLVRDLERAIGKADGRPVRDVLDVFCGTRPYEDLLPPGARCVGLDYPDNPYGVADVVTNEFLPFPDESFDLVLCLEAFHYVTDPHHGVAELRRVLRPGGTVIVAVPLVWEYDRTIVEHRYTGPALSALFEGWQQVEVVENGGMAVSWATLTGWMANIFQLRLRRRYGLRDALNPAFGLVYLAINGVGALLDRAERGFDRHPYTLPMNLLLTARRPSDG